MLGNMSQVAVALRECCLGGIARDHTRPERHNHDCFRRALGDLATGAALVVRATRHERGKQTRLAEQAANLEGAIDVAGGQRGHCGLRSVGTHSEHSLPQGMDLKLGTVV